MRNVGVCFSWVLAGIGALLSGLFIVHRISSDCFWVCAVGLIFISSANVLYHWYRWKISLRKYREAMHLYETGK